MTARTDRARLCQGFEIVPTLREGMQPRTLRVRLQRAGRGAPWQGFPRGSVGTIGFFALGVSCPYMPFPTIRKKIMTKAMNAGQPRMNQRRI